MPSNSARSRPHVICKRDKVIRQFYTIHSRSIPVVSLISCSTHIVDYLSENMQSSFHKKNVENYARHKLGVYMYRPTFYC